MEMTTPESYPSSPPHGYTAPPPPVYPYGQGGPYIVQARDGITDRWAITALIAWLLLAVYIFRNFCYGQGKTGQSIGKSVLKFKAINEKTWQPIGFWLSFVRQIAHYVDQIICQVGYLLPVVGRQASDDRRQDHEHRLRAGGCAEAVSPAH